MKAAIYARVSTKARSKCPVCTKVIRVVDDHLAKHLNRGDLSCKGSGRLVEESADQGQDTENQLIQLRAYCERQGWIVTREYVDRKSAKNSDRDSFKSLFDDASRRLFDVVIVWALDRFTREGVYETFDHIRKLTTHGVKFESYTEAHFRTTGPAGELMLAISAWIAQQERIRISERTKAGLDRARAAGRVCGRPQKIFRRDEAERLRASGLSWRAIEREMGVGQSTIRFALKKAAAK